MEKNRQIGVYNGNPSGFNGGRKNKLSREQIVGVFKDPRPYSKISAEYGIHTSMVGFIKNKKVHKEILKDL